MAGFKGNFNHAIYPMESCGVFGLDKTRCFLRIRYAFLGQVAQLEHSVWS
jgi:hypothetical protein